MLKYPLAGLCVWKFTLFNAASVWFLQASVYHLNDSKGFDHFWWIIYSFAWHVTNIHESSPLNENPKRLCAADFNKRWGPNASAVLGRNWHNFRVGNHFLVFQFPQQCRFQVLVGKNIRLWGILRGRTTENRLGPLGWLQLQVGHLRSIRLQLPVSSSVLKHVKIVKSYRVQYTARPLPVTRSYTLVCSFYKSNYAA